MTTPAMPTGYNFADPYQHATANKELAETLKQHQKNMGNFNVALGNTKLDSLDKLEKLQIDLLRNTADTEHVLSKIEYAENISSQIKPTIDELKTKLRVISNQEKYAAKMVEIDISIQKLNEEFADIMARGSLVDLKKFISKLEDGINKTIKILNVIGEDEDFKNSVDMKFCCLRLNMLTELSSVVYTLKADLKTKKHAYLGREILKAPNQEIALLNKFREGDEVPIKNYLKLGHEGEAIIRGIQGTKSTTENAKFQEAFDYLLENFNKARISVTTKNIDGKLSKVIEVYVSKGRTLELTPQSFRNVDFTQLNVNKSQLKRYENLCKFSKFNYNPNVSSNPEIYPHYKHEFPTLEDFIRTEELCEMKVEGKLLSFAEKLAINIYTTDVKGDYQAYKLINALLRGDIEGAARGGGLIEADAATEGLIHTVVLLTALNKLPHELGVTTFRAESSSLPNFVLNSWLKAANEGQDYVQSYALLSSAKEKPSDDFFDETKSKGALILWGVNGVNITPWSMFGREEREVVYLPTTLKIIAAQQVNVSGNMLTILLAKSVGDIDLEHTKIDKTIPAAQNSLIINRTKVVDQMGKIQEIAEEKRGESWFS
jgi:hypothetical protein